MPVSNFLTIERFRVTLTANGKREIQAENISNKKIAGKTVQRNSYGFLWRETIDFFAEVINSKRQEKGKLGHAVQIHFCRLP